MFDFTGAVSGLVFLLIIIFLAPALLAAGFARMSGEKVRMPSVVKPVLKTLWDMAAGLWNVADLVAQAVADRLPPKYETLEPLVALAIRFAFICISVFLFLRFLSALADR